MGRSVTGRASWSPPYIGPVESYRERLTVPASWWVVPLIFGGICGWIMLVATTPQLGIVAALGGTVAAGALIWSYGSVVLRWGCPSFPDGLAVTTN